MQETMYWSSAGPSEIRCHLCPHECLIREGQSGVCKVRVNRGGGLFSLVNGQLAAIHTDPVEKKPLYHFYPGRRVLSVGTRGCNLRCSFCQNHMLSQYDSTATGHETTMVPEELVRLALSVEENTGIAYTYNEPTIFYEFMLDTALKAHHAGLKNVAVTNGFINVEPLRELLPVMDAFNVDLKAFSDHFYRRMTGGRLAPVLETLKTIASSGVHMEITMLVIPTLNDSEEEFRELTDWISSALGPHIPLHLSRYFPAWKLDLPPTPVVTLDRFAAIASEKLQYVYIGNVGVSRYSSTFCPACGNEVIQRKGYQTEIIGLLPGGICKKCGYRLTGIF